MERLLTLARRRTKTLPVIIILGVTAAAVGARALLASRAGNPPEPAAVHSADDQAQTRAGHHGDRNHDMTSQVVTIYPDGFGPAEITRPKGKFLLLIIDRSGLEAVDLRLTHERGERMREVRVGRNKPRRSELVNLNPGRYTLTEANHPDWSCQITITPH